MDLYDEFLGLVDLLNEAGVGYALCGGIASGGTRGGSLRATAVPGSERNPIAVALHGFPRFTSDIDILIQPMDVTRVEELFGGRGFVIKAGAIPFDVGTSREREIHRISKVEGVDLLTVDLLLVSSSLQGVFEERDVFEWRGRQVQVVSLNGLATMKRLAGRVKDLLDLKELGLLDDEGDGNDS